MSDYSQLSQIRMMRVFVFYDLPTTNKIFLKKHSEFNGFLLKNGFYMIQESIYCCLARNQDYAQIILNKVEKNTPKAGDVRAFMITELQYQDIKIFSGKKSFQEKLSSIDSILEI